MNRLMTPAEIESAVWQIFLEVAEQEYPELSPDEREVKAWEILAEATGQRVVLTRNEHGDIVKQEGQP